MKIIIIWMTLILSLTAVEIDKKVDYLNNVKELIILTQVMRGDTNVKYKAEEFNSSLIDSDRQKVAKSLTQLHEKFTSVEASTNREFVKINQYMKSLNLVASELDSMITFKANSLLIKEMLRVASAVQSQFFKDALPLSKSASSLMINKILPLSEDIGQLRGLSAGASSCRHCLSDEDREYIKDLLAQSYDDLDEFIILMKHQKEMYPHFYKQNLELKRFKRNMKTFLNKIETNIVTKEIINSNHCFEEGTTLIAQLLRYYNLNEKVLLMK